MPASETTGLTLIVMRHGQAQPGTIGGEDRQRPLTSAGEQAAREVGERLAADGLHPGLVLCSSATRTRQTWDQVGLSVRAREVRYVDAMYAADVGAVLDLLAELGDDEARVLVIGHNPTLSQLVEYLGGRGAVGGSLRPADTAVLGRQGGDWTQPRAGSWRVLALHR